jgi:soluble lytic murein transglycosylase-like protein
MFRSYGTGAIISLVASAMIVVPVSALADTSVSSKSRAKLFSSQVSVLDKRAATQYSNSSRLQPPSSRTGTKAVSYSGYSGSVPQYRGRYKGPYLQVARNAARKNGVPEDLFLRLVQQESNWKVKAKSHKGAIGLAQLMPQTAADLRVDPHDPAQNLDGGARYLRMMYDRYNSWRLALAAYNAGPGAVDKHGGVPPYNETKTYVRKIWGS